jgi:transposase
MMGIKVNQAKMFYHFSLSQRVPEDHFLRTVADLLDLRFVRELVADKYSHTGQRSIDPEVLFKMMLVGYFYGITSERRLAEEISLNMAYMWYLGYDLDEPTPHHSVISKARTRYGKEVFQRFFNRILEECVKAGLVRGEKVFMDSTHIRADASLKSLVPRLEAVEPKYSSQEFVDKVFSENAAPPEEKEKEEDPPSSEGSGTRKSCSNKTHVSKTDPEASVVSHGQKLPLQMAYKEHFTVDSTARVITAVEVTPAHIGDESQLEPLLEQQPVCVKEVGADSKYGTCSNYKYLLEHGILPSIPPWNPGSPSKAARFSPKRFTYDIPSDAYTCPAGKKLTRTTDTVHNNCHTYHAKKNDCHACLLRTRCVSVKVGVRHIFRTVHQDYKDRALEHLSTEQAKQTLRQRKTYAEWINAESKTRHGLRRAMFRGLCKVTMQVLMTASVQNIKRLITHKSIPILVFKELSCLFSQFLSLLRSRPIFT